MRSLILLCTLLTAYSVGADAQQWKGLGGPLAEADLLYFADRPREAYALLSEYLDRHPDDYEALWRAARAGVVAGVAEEGTRRQNLWLDPAMGFGDRAVALRPNGVDGRYWRAAAVGRRAINASPGYSARLAQQVYDDAHAILAQDPSHGGAHNLLGKLNYEIMSLSWIERGIGRLIVGNEALRKSSWEDAEFHLRSAAESWPDLVLFQFDLAQLYRKRGRDEEARRVLTRVTEMPSLHPTDKSFKQDARAYLEELDDS